MAIHRIAERDRFTRKSRTGRSRIPYRVRENIFARDGFVCQFCKEKFSVEELTIDHIIPLAQGGIDELTNYVTACKGCNEKKGCMSMEEFAKLIKINIQELPVSGDSIIDNKNLPIQFRLLRKKNFDETRLGNGKLQSGTAAQKKLEKTFRREFHATDLGKETSTKYPNLPGPVRVMLPQIMTIGKNDSEVSLLIELAKSANTRNLIGTDIVGRISVIDEVEIAKRRHSSNPALVKRINWAVERWQRIKQATQLHHLQLQAS